MAASIADENGMAAFSLRPAFPALVARVPYLALHSALACSPSCSLQLLDNHGPLDAREPGQIFEGPARMWRVPVHAQ